MFSARAGECDGSASPTCALPLGPTLRPGKEHAMTVCPCSFGISAWRVTIICAAVVVAGALRAHADINVWTSQAPEGGAIGALVIDPVPPTTLYAALGCGRFTPGGGSGGVLKGTTSWSSSGSYEADGAPPEATRTPTETATPE